MGITEQNLKANVKAYRDANNKAIEHLSYAEVRTHSPISFIESNFPLRLEPESLKQLYKFSDIMSELVSRSLITDFQYSEKEIDSLKALQKLIHNISGKNALMGPLKQIPLYRAIHSFDPDRRCRILEIGPGSGHLGAMLLNDGYSYSAVEVTESLFLWCSVLFKEVKNSNFQICISDSDHPNYIQNGLYSWWNYANWWKNIPNFDIVIVEAALGEMGAFSVYYLQKLAKMMFDTSSPNGALIYSKIGEHRQMRPNEINDGFAKYGLKEKIVDEIYFYSLAESLNFKAIKPVGSGKLRNLDNYEQTGYSESYDFFHFLEIIHK